MAIHHSVVTSAVQAGKESDIITEQTECSTFIWGYARRGLARNRNLVERDPSVETFEDF